MTLQIRPITYGVIERELDFAITKTCMWILKPFMEIIAAMRNGKMGKP